MLLWILLAFQIKHFICDFPLQAFPYQYRNKGTYGHPGGLLHSGIHGLGTLLVCLPFGLPAWLAPLDAAIHYHIDWAKMRLNARLGLKPDNSEWFWIWLGFDQFLHQLTYLGLVGLAWHRA